MKPVMPVDPLTAIIDAACEALKDSLKPKHSARAAIEAAVKAAHGLGIDYALASEEKAWKRSTDLEDVIIEIVRYAPGGTMMKARALAAQIEAESPA